MDRSLNLFAGIGLGAGLMYFLDPQMGRRRRALLGDKMTSAFHEAGDALRVAGRDLGHRAQGLAAETRSLVAGGEVSDSQLVQRVRSKIGRYLAHPGSIEVAVNNGRVKLSGPILGREVDRLLDAVSSVPGVAGVEKRLEVHARAGNVASLQGGVRRPGERLNLREANWAPATRLLAGAAGGALLAYGFTQRFPVACVLGTAGLGLLARAAANNGRTDSRSQGSRTQTLRPLHQVQAREEREAPDELSAPVTSAEQE